jgi:hypothetical protein
MEWSASLHHALPSGVQLVGGLCCNTFDPLLARLHSIAKKTLPRFFFLFLNIFSPLQEQRNNCFIGAKFTNSLTASMQNWPIVACDEILQKYAHIAFHMLI